MVTAVRRAAIRRRLRPGLHPGKEQAGKREAVGTCVEGCMRYGGGN